MHHKTMSAILRRYRAGLKIWAIARDVKRTENEVCRVLLAAGVPPHVVFSRTQEKRHA